MAHGGDLFAIGDGVPSEQNFEVAFRGYKQEQVDNFVRLTETDLATVTAERDDAYAQLQALATQVHQLQLELVESRQRVSGPTTVTTNVSFRHLGDRVGQILAMAEDQAEAIRADAYESVAGERVEAERLLEDARRQHDQAIRDFEAALAARRAEEDAAATERRAKLDAETAQAQEYAGRVRAEAEAALSTAQQEARRLTEHAAGQAEQVHAETDAYVAHHRAALEHETVQRRAAVEAELAGARSQSEHAVAGHP